MDLMITIGVAVAVGLGARFARILVTRGGVDRDWATLLLISGALGALGLWLLVSTLNNHVYTGKYHRWNIYVAIVTLSISGAGAAGALSLVVRRRRASRTRPDNAISRSQ